MYWKFILVNLLLVLPNCRILTSGTFEQTPEDGDLAAGPYGPYNEDAVLERIVGQLTALKDKEGFLKGKKDEIDVRQYGDNTHNGINLESQDPKDDQTHLVNAPSGNNSSDTPPAPPAPYGNPGKSEPLQHEPDNDEDRRSRLINADDKQFIIIVAAAVSTGFVGLMMAGVCYYKFRKSAKAASDVEYPAYGVTGPVKDRIPSPGDRKLAQSAQMYHYQHQKQQMIAMEKANGDMKHDGSDDDSEEDNVEGDYTVYECPGLAPTGEMEVRNPLFRGDDTPVTPGQDITGQPHGQEQPSGNQ